MKICHCPYIGKLLTLLDSLPSLTMYTKKSGLLCELIHIAKILIIFIAIAIFNIPFILTCVYTLPKMSWLFLKGGGLLNNPENKINVSNVLMERLKLEMNSFPRMSNLNSIQLAFAENPCVSGILHTVTPFNSPTTLLQGRHNSSHFTDLKIEP